MICALCGDRPDEHHTYNAVNYTERMEQVLGIRVVDPGARVCWDCLLLLSITNDVCIRVVVELKGVAKEG